MSEVQVRVGRLRQVVPDSLEFYFGIVARETRLRGRAARAGGRRRRGCAATDCAPRVGDRAARRSAARAAGAATCGSSRRGARGRVHRGRGGAAHAPREGQGRRGRARRQQHDRARPTAPTSTARGVTVVNLMSAPGAGKTTLLERALRRARRRARGRARGRRAGQPRRRPARRACTSRSSSSTPTAASAASATWTRTWSARRCPSLPLDELDLLIVENVGNLVCPAEFRIGEDARVMVCVGHRGRGQAAQVPAHVPRLRAGGGQQDRPAAAPGLRPGRASGHLDAVHPGVERC